jgi:hypothetical protein
MTILSVSEHYVLEYSFLVLCQEAEEKAKEEEIAATVASKGAKKSTQTARPVDTDPDGDKLMHVCTSSPSYMCLCRNFQFEA